MLKENPPKINGLKDVAPSAAGKDRRKPIGGNNFLPDKCINNY